LPKITYKLVNINSCAVYICMYALLYPSPIPPPDLGITFTWTSKQSTYLNFHCSLCFQIQFQDTGRHVYYWWSKWTVCISKLLIVGFIITTTKPLLLHIHSTTHCC